MVSTPPYSSRTWSSRSCVEQFGIYKDEDQLTGYNYYKNSTRFVRTFVVAAILGVVTLLVCLMVNDIAKTTSGASTKRDRDGMHILLATPRPPRRTMTNQTTTTTNYTNLTSIPSTTSLAPDVHSSTQTTTTIFSADHTPYLTIESATKILHGDSQIHEHEHTNSHGEEEDVVQRMDEEKQEDEETEESKDYSVEYSSDDDDHENLDDDEEESVNTEIMSNEGESVEYNDEEDEEEEEVEQNTGEAEVVVDNDESGTMTEALPYTIDKPSLMNDPNNLTENVTSFDEAKSEAITYAMNNKHVRGNNYSQATPVVRTRQYVNNRLYGSNAPKIHIHLPYPEGASKSNMGFYTHPRRQYNDHLSYERENEENSRRSGKFDKNVNLRFQNSEGNRYLKKKKRKRLPVEKQVHLQPPLRRHSIVEEYQTPILIDYDTHKGLHINHNLVNSLGGGDGIRRVSVDPGYDDSLTPMGQFRRQKNIKRNSDQVSIARSDDEVEHRQMEYPTFGFSNVQPSSRSNENYPNVPNQNHPVSNENGGKNRKPTLMGQSNRNIQDISKPVHEYEDNEGNSENQTPMQEKIEDAAFEAYAKYWNPYLEDLNTDAMVSEATEARIVNRTPKRDHRTPPPKPFVAKGTTKPEVNTNLKKKVGDGLTSGTKKYPQLTNYHYPKDAKNIRDIIKYLTNIDETKTKQDSKLEKVKKPHGTIMKLKGVYLDHGEDIYKYNEDKNDENINDELKTDAFDFVYKNNDHFTSLNGHAYIADPFYQYKPENMADINSLVSPDFRFPTPTNEALFKHTLNHLNEKKRIGLSHNPNPNPNTKYFPKPPISFHSRPISAPSNNIPKQVPGKYTTAIYRPLGATRNDKHENGGIVKKVNTPKIMTDNEYQLDQIKKNLARRGKSKPKPLSVMLDIYPLLDQHVPEVPTRLPPPTPPNRVKFNPINFGMPMYRPVNSFVPRPYRGLRKGAINQKRKDEGAGGPERFKTQMVVHLNLHPKKKNQNGDLFRADERQKTNSRMDINRRKMNVYPKRRHYNEDYEGEIKRDNDDDYYEDDAGDEETYEEGEGEVVDTTGVSQAPDEPNTAGDSATRPAGEGGEDDDVKGENKENEDNQGSDTHQYRGVVRHEDEDEDDEDEFKGRELTLVLNADFMRPQERNEYYLRRGKAVPLIGENTGRGNETVNDQRNVTAGLNDSVRIDDVNFEGSHESTTNHSFTLMERNDEQGNTGEEIKTKEMNVDDVKVDLSKSEIEMTNMSQVIAEVNEDGMGELVADTHFNLVTESTIGFIGTPINVIDENVEQNNSHIAAENNIMKLYGFTIVQVATDDDNNVTELVEVNKNYTDDVKENPLLLLLKTELENGGESKEEEKQGSTSETEEEINANADVIEKDNDDVRYSVEETEVNTEPARTRVTKTTPRGNISNHAEEYNTFSRREDPSIVEQMYSDIIKFTNTQNETTESNESNMDSNSNKYSATYSKNVNELLH